MTLTGIANVTKATLAIQDRIRSLLGGTTGSSTKMTKSFLRNDAGVPVVRQERTTISDLARRLANGEGGVMPSGLPAAAWRQDVQGRADALLSDAGLRSPSPGSRGRW